MICRRCNDEIVSDVGCRCGRAMPPREYLTQKALPPAPQKPSYPVEVSQPRHNTIGHHQELDHGVDNC